MSGQTETVAQNQEDTGFVAENETVKEKGKSDDKCIGNRKIRTVILCLLLLAFSVFAAGYLFLLIKYAKSVPDSVPGRGSKVSGANCIVAALILTMIFTLVTMVLVCLKNCDPNKTNKARLPGFLLIFCGSLYLGGWVWYISADKEAFYSSLSPKLQQQQDATYLAQFGEALLYGATVILLGLDLLIPHRFLLEDEFKRLFLNLGILCGQSILTMPAYFILNGEASGALVIAIGYIVICLSTSIYIILFLTSCCCAKAKDKGGVRKALALSIMIGGVVTAIGYYVYAGGYETLGSSGDNAKRVAYYIGYTILVGGLCFVWGLDIAWDDIKDD